MAGIKLGKGERSGVDVIGVHGFDLEIDGVVAGSFLECSAFTTKVEVRTHSHGSDVTRVHKSAGKITYDDITCTKGLTDNTALWEWYKQIIAGDMTRKSISIITKNNDGTEAGRVNLFEAWISGFKRDAFKGSDNAVSKDEVTITYEYGELG
ncbi:MAG TPA: phage tail protein [Myxococcota bacterium]|jgi:phage tail-like protein|nr:phage tail protein [Myxococcota bacterium]